MKNTMINVLAELFCPLFCISCGEKGGVLCMCCRKNMACKYERCLSCGEMLVDRVCRNCALPFERQLCVGERKAVLKDLINIYKYQSVRACCGVLAEIVLDGYEFEENDYIVPLPTISRHKRERGFGHIEKLARCFAARSRAKYAPLLKRINRTVQVGADSEKRKKQAESAYAVSGKVDPNANYYLLDDVWTTGSSMIAAAKKLRSAGAQRVNAILIAKTV